LQRPLPPRNEEKVPRRILVINDTEEILELFRLILGEELGHEVILDSYKPHMVETIKDVSPDLIISDHVFGDEKVGWQLLQRLRMDRETANIPMIICSAAIKELKEMEGFLTAKGVGVLYKPFDVDELIALVNLKLEEAETERTGHERRTRTIEENDNHKDDL
jgi:DNA-binding response OmpR family regulator